MEATLGLTRHASKEPQIAADEAAALAAHRAAERERKERQAAEAREAKAKRVAAAVLGHGGSNTPVLASSRTGSPSVSRRPSVTPVPDMALIQSWSSTNVSQSNKSTIHTSNHHVSHDSSSASHCDSGVATPQSTTLNSDHSCTGTPSRSSRALTPSPGSPPMIRRGRSLSISSGTDMHQQQHEIVTNESNIHRIRTPIAPNHLPLPRVNNNGFVRSRSNSVSANAESVFVRLTQTAMPADRATTTTTVGSESVPTKYRSIPSSRSLLNGNASTEVHDNDFESMFQEVPSFIKQVQELDQLLAKTGLNANTIVNDSHTMTVSKQTMQDAINGEFEFESSVSDSSLTTTTTTTTTTTRPSSSSMSCSNRNADLTPAAAHSTFVQYKATLEKCRLTLEEGITSGQVTGSRMSEALAFIRQHDKNSTQTQMIFEMAYEAGQKEAEARYRIELEQALVHERMKLASNHHNISLTNNLMVHHDSIMMATSSNPLTPSNMNLLTPSSSNSTSDMSCHTSLQVISQLVSSVHASPESMCETLESRRSKLSALAH